jgi:hypothetical protein
LSRTPDRDAALGRPEENRVIGMEAGRDDHELWIEAGYLIRDTLKVVLEIAAPDDVEQLFLFVPRR